MSAAEAHRLLAKHGATVAVAESLTGGLIGAVLTAVPGASATFAGGVIAYQTRLKCVLLGVPRALLDEHGAVYPDVAEAMARGVRERLGATYGVAVTGVAGPEPQDGQPPGTVHIAVAGPDGTVVDSPVFPDAGRDQIRRSTVTHALDLLCRHLA